MSSNSKMTNQSSALLVSNPSSPLPVGLCISSSILRVPSGPVKRAPSGTLISARLPTFAVPGPTVHCRLWRTLLASLSGSAPWFSAAEEAPGAAENQGAEPESEANKVLRSLQWTVGPGTAKVGNLAEIKVPEGARFTGPDGTRKMLELMHNPTGSGELGLLTNNALDWFVIFEFEDIGYVKDADKEKLDGQAILESLREGNEAGNEERKKRGWAPITIVGWHTAPFYNKETNNLEWCVKGQSQGHDIVNY